MTRRDVYLRVGQVWEVETRQGGPEGMSQSWRFDTEEEARAFVDRCLVGPGEWRELTSLARAHEREPSRDAGEEASPP